jgi:hypothetical protein
MRFVLKSPERERERERERDSAKKASFFNAEEQEKTDYFYLFNFCFLPGRRERGNAGLLKVNAARLPTRWCRKVIQNRSNTVDAERRFL